MQDIYDLHHKGKDITERSNLSSIYSTKLSQTARHNDRIVNFNILDSTVNKSLSGQTRKLQKEQKDRLDNCQKDFGVETELKLFNIDKTTESIYSFKKNQTKILPESRKEIYHDTDINFFNCMSKHSINTQNVAELKLASDNIDHSKEEVCNSDSTISVVDNEPLDLVIHSKKSTQHSHIYSEAKDRICSYPYSSIGDKGTLHGAILRQIDHSSNIQTYNAEYKNIDYGLLKLFDLNELSCTSSRDKELLKSINKLHINSSETNGRTVTNNDLKQERAHILDKYVTHVLPPRLSSDSKTSSWTHLQSNAKCNNIKKECCTKEETRKSENTNLVQLTACIPKLSNWACFEMSGQYPGHSRPPVGTPPPQTVWNHLTMTQGQGNLSFRLDIVIFYNVTFIFNMLTNHNNCIFSSQYSPNSIIWCRIESSWVLHTSIYGASNPSTVSTYSSTRSYASTADMAHAHRPLEKCHAG